MRALAFPNNVQVETTSHCNAHCGFCPHPETSRTEPQGVMDEPLFESIVEQLSHHPVELIQPFLNNDPLTDPRLLPRLELIRRFNPRSRVSITTNGLRLRADLCREVAGLGLDTIHVSSHALTPDVYRETMGLDAWTVLRNVNVLQDELRRRQARTRLVVTAVLLEANRAEVQHMHDYWRSRGIEFYLNPLNNRAGNLSPRTFLRLLPLERPRGAGALRSYDMSGCPALYSFMGILWNGDVITCCMDWRRARVLGNARAQSLQDIWQGRPYTRLRALSDDGRLSEEPLCRQCGQDRFSIDPRSLRDLVDRQGEEGRADRQVLELVEALRAEPNVVQMGLLRGGS